MSQLAHVAPETDDAPYVDQASDAHLDALCEAWAAWCRTRRFYGRVSVPVSLLGKLRSPERGRYQGGPNGPASAELAAFNLAVMGEPDGRDRRIFELHYLWRAPNISAAAAASGVSRAQWYRIVADVRRRAYAVSRDILAANLAAGEVLPSQRADVCSDVTTPPLR